MTNKKTTVQKRTIQTTAFVGQCFHSVENKEICWQGMVIGNPEPGWYLVQLYEWLMGSPNVQRLVRIEDMQDWMFYDDNDQMVYSYEYGAAKHYKARQKSIIKKGETDGI
jgi:hypothetical protein